MSGSSVGASSYGMPESRALFVDPGEPEATATHNHMWTLVRLAVDSSEQKRRRINESPDLSRGLG